MLHCIAQGQCQGKQWCRRPQPTCVHVSNNVTTFIFSHSVGPLSVPSRADCPCRWKPVPPERPGVLVGLYLGVSRGMLPACVCVGGDCWVKGTRDLPVRFRQLPVTLQLCRNEVFKDMMTRKLKIAYTVHVTLQWDRAGLELEPTQSGLLSVENVVFGGAFIFQRSLGLQKSRAAGTAPS